MKKHFVSAPNVKNSVQTETATCTIDATKGKSTAFSEF